MEITVRRAEPDDYEAFYATFSTKGAYSGTLQTPYPSREKWKKRLSEPAEGHYVFVACIDGQPVGNAGLHGHPGLPRREHAMEIGLAVRDGHTGKGVGSALMAAIVDFADNWLNVIRLELTVYTDNERAIALYRKCGFEIEGTLRAYALRDGGYVDAYAMGRVRPKRAPV